MPITYFTSGSLILFPRHHWHWLRTRSECPGSSLQVLSPNGYKTHNMWNQPCTDTELLSRRHWVQSLRFSFFFLSAARSVALAIGFSRPTECLLFVLAHLQSMVACRPIHCCWTAPKLHSCKSVALNSAESTKSISCHSGGRRKTQKKYWSITNKQHTE